MRDHTRAAWAFLALIVLAMCIGFGLGVSVTRLLHRMDRSHCVWDEQHQEYRCVEE